MINNILLKVMFKVLDLLRNDDDKTSLFLYNLLHKEHNTQDLVIFLFNSDLPISFKQKMQILKNIYRVTFHVSCPHNNHEMLSYISTILSIPPGVKGCVVEAGSFKGGSGAKFSIACKMVERKLVLFDSFEGIPDNIEPHKFTIDGRDYTNKFVEGSFCGTYDEVISNITKYGEISACEFVKGWFDETMPYFEEPICAIYMDVDLASSTKTCLKYLYPLLVSGGVLYSQDGHLPLVIAVFKDEEFWKNEVGFPKPHIEGLGKQKLIKIIKP